MCMNLRVLTIVVRQVEQDSDDGLHTVLHRLPHCAAVRAQLPAVTLDHLLTPVQCSDTKEDKMRHRKRRISAQMTHKVPNEVKL